MAMSGIDVMEAVEAYNAMKTARCPQRLKVYMIAKEKMLEDPEFVYPADAVQTPEEKKANKKEREQELDKLVLKNVVNLLKTSWKDKCRLIIIDLVGETKADVHVIAWTAEGASIREKMTFASTFQAVKAKCDGCSNHSGESHDSDDFIDYLKSKKIGAASELEV